MWLGASFRGHFSDLAPLAARPWGWPQANAEAMTTRLTLNLPSPGTQWSGPAEDGLSPPQADQAT